MKKVRHPSLKQINTRTWLGRFDTGERTATLRDVPPEYWDYLAESGMDYVWLMGVWETTPASIAHYCFEPELVSSYKNALSDWTENDVGGSPYAIDRYRVSPAIGTKEDLLAVREELHRRGMRLILDFVPNHFNALSSLIEEQPEVFLQVSPEWIERDGHTFYSPKYNASLVLAHGRDPYFAAWQDTVQVNYAHPAARAFMVNTLLELAKVCDGVRCDMAMLMLNRVFQQTWGAVLDQPLPAEEFWAMAVEAVKSQYPNFVFLAEAYWDTEWELQQLGFDYTYDKRLTDRLKSEDPRSIAAHLAADEAYQQRSVRFLENHDEERILAACSTEQACAAAVVAYTQQGLRFYHHGQWEGKRIRVPVQLNREPMEEYCPCAVREHVLPRSYPGLQQRAYERAPIEMNCRCVGAFYDRLLPILKDPVFREGRWQMLEVQPHNGTNGIMAWQWQKEEDFRIVAVNYSPIPDRARVVLPDSVSRKLTDLTDLLNGEKRSFSQNGDRQRGLDLSLPPYKSRILGPRLDSDHLF